MNKTFRVYFEKPDSLENYWHDLPTWEEAEDRKEELEQEGFEITSIEEIRN